MDMLTGLHQLQVEGMTREMYIWGNTQVQHGLACWTLVLQAHMSLQRCGACVQGQWVRGIIDQLELDEMGQIRVVEHKTRRRPSLPMLAQQQTAKLQVHNTKGQALHAFLHISFAKVCKLLPRQG